MQKFFEYLVINHNFDEAIDLYEKNTIKYSLISKLYDYDINLKFNNNNIVMLAVMDNNLRFIQWLYEKDKELFDTNNVNMGFGFACMKNYKYMAQWINNHFTINYEMQAETTFRDLILISNLEMCKWLYELNENIFSKYINQFYKLSCTYNNIEMAKWFRSLKDSVKVNDNIYFCEAIENDNIKIAKWLYSFGNVNLKYNDNQPFKLAVKNNSLVCAIWLCNLCEDYKVEIDDDYEIINYKITDSFTRRLINDKNYKKRKFSETEENMNTEENEDGLECPVCMETKTYIVKLGCEHIYCRDCIAMINMEKCQMCMQKIKKRKISLIRQ